MARPLNQATLDLIKHFEGLFLEAYLCPAKVWTIGYGHTGLTHMDGTVKKGRKITPQQAEALLRHDLDFFAAGVEKLLLARPRAEISDNMFGALVSFAFNCGLTALKNSTLMQRVNARDYAAAVAEFHKWNTAKKRVLARRRKSESNLWCSFPNFIVPA
jgi:lysozyme